METTTDQKEQTIITYKDVVAEVLHDFWNDDPRLWWSQPDETIIDSDGSKRDIYIIDGRQCCSHKEEYETSSTYEYAILRLIAEKRKCSLFALPTERLYDRPTDIIVGFVNGPTTEDRQNIIWAWQNKHIYPWIGLGVYFKPIYILEKQPKYAICCALDTDYRRCASTVRNISQLI